MKPQDILVTLKLLVSGWPKSFAELGQQLGMSASAAHQAVKRARQSGLIQPDSNLPNKAALAEFLLFGLKYVFPAQPGSRSRGLPTSYAAQPLREEFMSSRPSSSDDNDVPVWPDPEGLQQGYELKPLYRSVPAAARNDSKLYEWLVLADALRSGRARERELAAKIVRKRLASA